jgi:hypothetical protein
MVPRQDRDPDAAGGQRRQRGGGAPVCRVVQAHEPHQRQFGPVTGAVAAGAGRAFGDGDGQHPGSLGGPSLGQAGQLIPPGGVHRQVEAVRAYQRAAVQHVLGRALGDEGVRVGPVGPPQHDGGQPAGGVERHGVDDGERNAGGRRVAQDGLVDEVVEDAVGRLDQAAALFLRPARHRVVGMPVGVEGPAHRGAVGGEGAGLVDAQHGDGTQVVDGRQPLDGDAGTGRLARGAGQHGGQHDGQHLGRQPDGHRDGERHGHETTVAEQQVDGEHERHAAEQQADEGPRDRAHGVLERRLGPWRRVGVQRADVAGRAGGDDHADAGARHHGAAREAHPGTGG